MNQIKILLTAFIFLSIASCDSKAQTKRLEQKLDSLNMAIEEKRKELILRDKGVRVGADHFNEYIPFLKNKNIAVVTNHTAVLNRYKTIQAAEILEDRGETVYGEKQHLVDALIEKGIEIKRIFAPEHGFRGKADAGEVVKDGKDVKTGLPIVSLYGSNKKPKPSQVNDLDVIVFDIQDVGVRFYTYISTLAYVMEAAAENNLTVLVLDRPNPNGHYIDGPVLESGFASFVGLHHVPVVYGMTIGEYAKMINGERWLKNGIRCNLRVIQLSNYKRKKIYTLPVKPSPNLPNAQSINLYPSLCFFEGTKVSVGRGTDMQFQVFGAPFFKENFPFQFTPAPNEGAKNPKHNGEICYGEDLREHNTLNQMNLSWLIAAYDNVEDKSTFFNKNLFFDKLAGNSTLRKQIQDGKKEKKIRASWQDGLESFKLIRDKYLLYPDF